MMAMSGCFRRCFSNSDMQWKQTHFRTIIKRLQSPSIQTNGHEVTGVGPTKEQIAGQNCLAKPNAQWFRIYSITSLAPAGSYFASAQRALKNRVYDINVYHSYLCTRVLYCMLSFTSTSKRDSTPLHFSGHRKSKMPGRGPPPLGRRLSCPSKHKPWQLNN